MENEYYRVSVDRGTGRVDIWDKELNRMRGKRHRNRGFGRAWRR